MNESSPRAFSIFVALWAVIVNTAIPIIILRQICQCALAAGRKRKGQDSERLKRNGLVVAVPACYHMSMFTLEKQAYDRKMTG